MKKFICLIVILSLMIVPVFGEEQIPVSRYDTFTTTHDMTRYSVFTAYGDVIEAFGFYEGDKVVGFELTGAMFFSSGYDVRTQTDGSYTAMFTGIPVSEFAIISIRLESGGVLNYRVDFDENSGWYFGDFGLSEANADVTADYLAVPVFVTVQYLVANGTREDAAAVLGEISRLTQEVTSGLVDDYDKARAISAWVAENIYYDKLAADNDVNLEVISLKNVLETRRGICSGYANLTAAMYAAAGIKAVTVIGSAVGLNEFDRLFTQNDRHEWTAFWYEDEQRWVMADSGWDSFNNYNGEYVQRRASFKHFDITLLAFAQNHRAVKSEFRDYFAALEYDFPPPPVTTPVQSQVHESHEPDKNGEVIIEFHESQRETTTANQLRYRNFIPLAVTMVGLVFAIVICTIIIAVKKRL